MFASGGLVVEIQPLDCQFQRLGREVWGGGDSVFCMFFWATAGDLYLVAWMGGLGIAGAESIL